MFFYFNFSKRFLYANDDYFFMESVCPEDFINENGSLVLYVKDKKNLTPYGQKKKYRWNCDCPDIKYQNGICDDECNKFECFWDGHDCDYQRPKSDYFYDPRIGFILCTSLKDTKFVLRIYFETLT